MLLGIVAWTTYVYHHNRQAEIVMPNSQYIDATTVIEILFPGQTIVRW